MVRPAGHVEGCGCPICQQMDRAADQEIREEVVEEVAPTPRFGEGARPTGSVHIETGRGQTTEVAVGQPFSSTIEQIAEEAHYGGYFRVFLNGEEILNPNEAPATIEAGMRIAVTSYDKVGKSVLD